MTDEEVLADLGRGPGDELAPFPDDTGAAPAGAVPPSDVDIVPPPDFGPPAPSPTDSIAIPPPPPGGTPTRDPDKEWPPPVPREAPGMVPLPGQGGTAPRGAPGPLVTAPAGNQPVGTADVANALGEQDKARKEREEADQRAAQGEASKTTAEADAATERREAAEESAKRAAKVNEMYDSADKAAQQHYAQAQEAFKNFKFKDYWADKSTAAKVASALGIALGALGSSLTHTSNAALEILNKDMDDDHRRQVEQLNQLSDEAIQAHTGIADTRVARQTALANLTMADAQKDKLIGARLTERAALLTDANSQNIAAASAAKFKEEAAGKEVEAQKMLRQLYLEDQVKAAQIEEEKARAAMYGAHAAGTGGFVPKHGKGSGGGGGAGSGAAYDAFRAAVLAAPDPNNIPNVGKLAAAAHLKPNQIQGEISKIRSADDTEKKKHAGAEADPALRTEVDAWRKQNGIDAISKQQRELTELQKQLKDNAHNPLQQALAVEKAVSAARGGAASKQALALALGHLGGSLDNAEAVVSKIKNGEMGEKQMENFRSFINGQLGSSQAAGKEAYDNFNKWAESQPEAKRPALLAERGRLFSGLAGFGGREGGGAPQGKRVQLKDGRTGTLTPDGMFHQDQ
jgi:hypothetical protein